MKRPLTIKFPRRVRIHGEEFDESARAIHRAGEKVALMKYEANFFTQAIKRIVRAMTFNERKQMSKNKTLKRFALVAVSAMGFGLLSIVPSQASGHTTTTISVTGIARAGVGMVLTFTSDSATSVDRVHYVTTGTVPAGTTITTGVDTLVAGTFTRTVTQVGVDTFTAGTVTLLVWANNIGSLQTAPGINDPSTTLTLVIAGVPAQLSLAATSTSVASSTTTNAKYVATVKDAAGVNTLVVASNTDYGVAVRATFSTGTVKVDSITATTGGQALTTAVALALDTASGTIGLRNNLTLTSNFTFWISQSVAATTTVAAVGYGLLAGATAATSSLTTVTSNYPAVATHINGGTSYSATAITVGTGSSATLTTPANLTGGTAETQSATASTQDGKSVTIRMIGGAAVGNTFSYTIAAITATALPTGVVAGTYATAATDTSSAITPAGVGFVDTTITATAAAAGSGYTVTIPVSPLNSKVYTITYSAPLVDNTRGTISLSPTGVVKAVNGTAVTLTATVKDQFGVVYAGANVIWSGSGLNTIAATTQTSSATGTSSFTYTDVAGTGGTQTFTATAQAPTLTTAVSASQAIIFGLASAVQPTTFTLTQLGGGTADAPITVDTVVTETATALNASGAVIEGVPVTFTVTSNGYAKSTTAVVYTNSSGLAVATFAGKTTGDATVTATAGTLSATKTFYITNGSSRTISLSAATLAIVGGETKKVTATVKDGYGNVVSGQSLTISYVGTAGRVSAVNGIIASSGSTGTDGTLIIDVSAATAEAGTGTLTVAGTMGNTSTSTLNVDGVTALPTAVKSVTSAATITVSSAATTADSVAASVAAGVKADAATAAATKAGTDAVAAAAAAGVKADAATDAAIEAGDKADAATNAALDAVDAADAATAAAQDAETAALEAGEIAQAGLDAATEAIDAANAATDAADAATDAADAATDAANEATEAAEAAGEIAQAALEAAEEARDAATEATDAGNAATDAGNAATEAADAATAAAEAATAAAEAAGEIAQMALEAAEEARDAALDSIEAGNAATDAANAAAEAADAATAAAEEATEAANAAVDAVAALSAQVATLIAGIKSQITALTNLIIKIQKTMIKIQKKVGA